MSKQYEHVIEFKLTGKRSKKQQEFFDRLMSDEGKIFIDRETGKTYCFKCGQEIGHVNYSNPIKE